MAGKRVGELLETIMSKAGLTREEVWDKIKRKQAELSGLVSEDGAAYLVANELGIKTQNRVVENMLKVKDIMPEMRAVTLNARVKAIFPPREFTTKTGTKGKVANLEVMDNTGTTRIVLWNMSDIEKVEKKEVNAGDIVQVKNGYVRDGFKGGYEVHLGSKGTLMMNPENVDEDEFPKVEAVGGMMKISELQPNMPVSVIGRVTHNFGINEFEKEDKKGKVANLVVNDGTGGARLVLWNEQADFANEVEVGDILQIQNAYSKEGMRGVEVQANWQTQIAKNPEGVVVAAASEGQSQRVKISDLNDGDTYKEIRGAVVDVYGDNFVYDMCPTCNKKITEGKCGKCGEIATPEKLVVVNTMIDDGSGMIRASFFREQAEKLFGMNAMELQASAEKVQKKKAGLLGKEIIVEGRVKKNDAYDRIEFNVYQMRDVDPAKEAGKLIDNLKNKEVLKNDKRKS
ncbi:MAG: DUF2240 family protein [archaeon]